MTGATGNDNAGPRGSACPYGPLGVVLVHVPRHATHPYRRLTRLPGALIDEGFATPQQAARARPTPVLPVSGVDGR